MRLTGEILVKHPLSYISYWLVIHGSVVSWMSSMVAAQVDIGSVPFYSEVNCRSSEAQVVSLSTLSSASLHFDFTST